MVDDSKGLIVYIFLVKLRVVETCLSTKKI